MATNDDKGLFWNSTNNDRLYDADSFGKWFSRFFTTGVMPGDFEVEPVANDMAVTMQTGYVNIDNPESASIGGKSRIFEDSITFELAMADSTNPRIDTIVIERNDTDREITAKIITGTPATTPVATAPIRTASIYQLVIAEIYVDAGTSTISSDKITMKRADSNVCGIVTGTVSNNEITYGNTDLEEGVSELADGVVYFVYE